MIIRYAVAILALAIPTFGADVEASYPGPYPGSRIMGGSGVCAVFTESAEKFGDDIGITHYYVGNYENDYIRSALPVFVVGGVPESVFGSASTRRPAGAVQRAVDMFSIETRFRSLTDTALEISYSVYSMSDGVILFDMAVRNDGAVPTDIEMNPGMRFRSAPDSRFVRTDNRRFAVMSTFGSTTIGLGSSEIDAVRAMDASEGVVALAISRAVLPGRTVRSRAMIFAVRGEGGSIPNISSLDTESAQKSWQQWMASGNVAPRMDTAVNRAYEAALIALAATSLDGAVPADMTGQFVTDGKPQLYPRDALMTARALAEAGQTGIAESIVRYWDRSIPQKNTGEWYARYDAYRRATPGGSGAPYDVPEWDSNGYYASLILRLFEMTGRWAGDHGLMKQLLDFVVSRQNDDGLVEEGGIIEWGGLLPATNMNLVAGLRDGALICDLRGEGGQAALYRAAADRMERGLGRMFSARRGAYMDLRDNREQFNTSANFGFVWGYPDHFELAATNAWYRLHTHKLGGGVQYFEADGYGSDCFGFTTGASAQYHALAGAPKTVKTHLDWMMNHSNIYGMMPERIFYPDAKEVSPASPLSWCNGEFAAAALFAARVNDPSVASDVSFALDGIVADLKGLRSVVRLLKTSGRRDDIRSLEKSLDRVVSADRPSAEFFRRAAPIQSAFLELGAILAPLTGDLVLDLGRRAARIRAKFERIVWNRAGGHLELKLSSDTIAAGEEIIATVSGSLPPGAVIERMTMEYREANREIRVWDGHATIHDGSFEARATIRFPGGVPPYETAIRATVVGSLNGLAFQSSRTVMCSVIPRFDITISSASDPVRVKVKSNLGLPLSGGRWDAPPNWKTNTTVRGGYQIELVPDKSVPPGYYPFTFHPAGVPASESYPVSVPYQTQVDLAGKWAFRTGDDSAWAVRTYDDRAWTRIPVPGNWENTGFPGYDGYAWYRVPVAIPQSWKGRDIELVIGAVDDQDWTYWNGALIGHVEVWNHQRRYRIRASDVLYGKLNTLAVRVYDGLYGGGIWKGPVMVNMIESTESAK